MLLVDYVGKNVTVVVNKDTVYFGRVESVTEGRITLLVVANESYYCTYVSIPIDAGTIIRMPQYEEWVGERVRIVDTCRQGCEGVLESTHRTYLTMSVSADGTEGDTYLKSYNLLDIYRITLVY